MRPEPAGQYVLLNILTQANHVFDGVAMADANNVLLDDRAFIKILGYVVAGSSNQLHTTAVSLVVWPGTSERRQEAVVDIDHLARILFTKGSRQDLHVTGQNHHIGFRSEEHTSELQSRPH